MLDKLKKDWDVAKIEHKSRMEKLKINPNNENTLLLQEAEKDIELAKLAYETEKDRLDNETRIAKAEEKEELNELQTYEKFCNARDAYEKYKFGFLRRSGEFFMTKVFVDRDRHDPELERYTTEIENYKYEMLGKAFIELNHKVAVNYLRKMVEGKPFKVKISEGEYEEWSGERRIYHKLVNTMHVPDEDTYNVINLDNIVQPNGKEDTCPWILKCLFTALGAGKPENIEYVEKWIYSVAVADIGNNQTPFPVFYGRGKIGKNALTEMVIPAILGKELIFSSTWDVIGESNFTQFKLGKVLMFIDEIPERSEWTKIKNWTGSVTEYIKVKYGPEYTIDNVIALAFGSNEKSFPLPWEDGDQMQRVSPLKAGDKTFAEYVTEYADIMIGREYYETLIKDKIGEVPDTPHMMGDKFLRHYKPLWIGKEEIQKLVNYLDTKYNPGDGRRFVLTPLRGKDWEELVNEKKDYLNRALDWCLEKKTDYVIPDEVYAVFEHMNKVANKTMYKKPDAFYRQLAEELKKLGWAKNDQCYVEYNSTLHQVLHDKGEKKTSTRKNVWFAPNRVKQSRVPSLSDLYFKRVLVNLKEETVLSD